MPEAFVKLERNIRDKINDFVFRISDIRIDLFSECRDAYSPI